MDRGVLRELVARPSAYGRPFVYSGPDLRLHSFAVTLGMALREPAANALSTGPGPGGMVAVEVAVEAQRPVVWRETGGVRSSPRRERGSARGCWSAAWPASSKGSVKMDFRPGAGLHVLAPISVKIAPERNSWRERKPPLEAVPLI